jgi:hypothetical protein
MHCIALQLHLQGANHDQAGSFLFSFMQSDEACSYRSYRTQRQNCFAGELFLTYSLLLDALRSTKIPTQRSLQHDVIPRNLLNHN